MKYIIISPYPKVGVTVEYNPRNVRLTIVKISVSVILIKDNKGLLVAQQLKYEALVSNKRKYMKGRIISGDACTIEGWQDAFRIWRSKWQ